MMEGTQADILNDPRVTFDKYIDVQLSKKKSTFMSPSIYKKIVSFLKKEKTTIDDTLRRRINRNKYVLMNYPVLGLSDILCVPSVENFPPLGKYKRVAHTDNIFDIIDRAHNKLIHSGEHKTFNEIRQTYANIPRQAVNFFISLCSTCAEKAQQQFRDPIKPIVENGFLQRVQYDLISQESKPDGSFNYIGHIVDHFSKFHVLFPLESKGGYECTMKLIERFISVFGLPKIIHSDNGPEFVNSVMDSLSIIWPGNCSIVHGKPYHPQSQGLVEQAHTTIRKMLSVKQKETKSSSWSNWLPEIQFILNTTLARGHKKTPYEVVFGFKPNGVDLLGENHRKIEEDFINDIIEDDVPISVPHPDFSLHATSEQDTDDSFKPVCEKRNEHRNEVHAQLIANAQLMKQKSSRGKRRKIADFSLGQHVTVAIPKKLRHSSDMRRLPCIVVNRSHGDQPTYKLLCSEGTLQGRFSGSVLMPYPGLVKCKLPDGNDISLSEAVKKVCNVVQIFCRCKGSCNNNACLCFKSNTLCKDRCHTKNRVCTNVKSTNCDEQKDAVDALLSLKNPVTQSDKIEADSDDGITGSSPKQPAKLPDEEISSDSEEIALAIKKGGDFIIRNLQVFNKLPSSDVV